MGPVPARRAARLAAAFFLITAGIVLAAAPWIGPRLPWIHRSAPADGEGAAIVFSAADPPGDDRGAGGLTYPTHRAFEPYEGLFDLQRFQVSVQERLVHIDFTFGHVTNPFAAPEGFYHQRVDVYIVTDAREGSTEPFQPGPKVQFHPDFPWSVRLRIAPFGGTRLHTYRDPRDSPGRSRGIAVRALPDGKTIRVTVPVELLGLPRPHWRWYVLVGGYDHFGEDEWRDVVEGDDPWAFGGAADGLMTPRVMDLLAPARGWWSQSRQLGRVPPEHVYPVVRPVPVPQPWAFPLAALAAAAALAAGWRLAHTQVLRRRER